MNNEKWNTAITRGKCIPFRWQNIDEKIKIYWDSEQHHEYTHTEILTALEWLQERFKTALFPLGNSVSKVGNETEKDGLGKALYSVKKNTTFAQGASYLGVVLEQMGVFALVLPRPISLTFAEQHREHLDAVTHCLKTYK